MVSPNNMPHGCKEGISSKITFIIAKVGMVKNIPDTPPKAPPKKQQLSRKTHSLLLYRQLF